MMITILLIALPLVGVIAGWYFRWLYGRFQLSVAENHTERILYDAKRDAEAKAKDIILDAQKTLNRERGGLDKEFKERRVGLQKFEQRLEQKEKEVDKYAAKVHKTENGFVEREKRIERALEGVAQQKKKLVEELENISDLTQEEAKNLTIQSLADEAEKDSRARIKKIEQDAEETAQRNARRILVGAIQRVVPEVSSEILQTTIDIPTEEMKGRIIGREGRNIRAIETVTGVDIVVDDTPEAIILSCFDTVRREVARQALEILIRDGRIHPARIEDTVNTVRREMDENLREKGEQMLYELGIHHIDPKANLAVGRLHFRSSYGQNILMHSKEVAILAGMIAAEIGADREIAKRGGLLHDVGKGIESSEARTHVELGVEFVTRIGESEEVINCVAAHHGDVPYSCVESVIVQVADSISASRPGARRESADRYLERLQHLESIAEEFDGVEKAFAIQAGKELRVLVNHEAVTDDQARSIARYIAKNIEDNLDYPGRIKVTIIRETRITEYAK